MILNHLELKFDTGTADFRKKVHGVYTHLIETIYLSLSGQVAVGTFFMKSPDSCEIPKVRLAIMVAPLID